MHCASIKKTLIGFFPISEWIKFVTLLSICGAEPFYSVFFLIFAPSNCTETLYRVYILWNVDENEWNGCNAQRTTKPTIKNVYTRNARSDEIVLIFHADTCNTGSWHNILLLYAIQLCEASKLLQWSPIFSMFMSLLCMS